MPGGPNSQLWTLPNASRRRSRGSGARAIRGSRIGIGDAIATTKDFPGITGKITLNTDRNPIKPAVMLRIENGRFVYVETLNP